MTNDQQSIRTSLGPHLPYLRRYGRALTGSQKSGDAFVRASLEALLDAPDQFNAQRSPRVELFRLFHAFWGPLAAISSQDGPSAGTGEAVGEGLMGRLPRGRREALLLTAVEGFSVAEAAIILDRSEEDVQADIDSARREIEGHLNGRVMIIEDEPLIAMHLQSIVEDIGHSVVGIATTRTEAVDLSRREAADLVLADIRLADGSSGIDAVKDILTDHDVPVIFITAYPERLLTGERPEPTYLITKPFEADTVIATIGQALMLQREPAEA
jgi:DNA-directed RNA polymerase specialized sigma24 family protein